MSGYGGVANADVLLWSDDRYPAGGVASCLSSVQVQGVLTMMSAQIAFIRACKFTIACAIILVLVFGSLFGTITAFAAMGLVSEGWMVIAALVWCLEMVFGIVFAMEYFD